MADDRPTYRDFGGAEALVRYVQERSGELERVVIPTSPSVLHHRGEPVANMSTAGMLLCYAGGGRELLSKADAEALLNDGVLNRMRIRIELAE